MKTQEPYEDPQGRGMWVFGQSQSGKSSNTLIPWEDVAELGAKLLVAGKSREWQI